jgi:signal peptidase I
VTVEQQGTAYEQVPEGAAGRAPRRRRRLSISLVLLVLGLLLSVAGVVPLATGFHLYSVSGVGMAPGIAAGDAVVTQKADGRTLQPGELVLVDTTGWGLNGSAFRRVVAVGGDRVACCTDGHVTVDGRPVDEPYATSANGGMPDYVVTVPAGRVFLLGDNREAALDSRMFPTRDHGTLPVSAVKARVVWKSHGGPVSGAAGPLDLYVGLTAFGLLLLGVGSVALVVSAVIALGRRRRRQPMPYAP